MTGTDYMVTDFVDSFFLFWELKHIPPKNNKNGTKNGRGKYRVEKNIY